MTYASWGHRFLGYSLDTLIVIVVDIAAAFALDAFVDINDANAEQIGWSIASIAGVLVAGYNRWIRAGRTGQTWGRQALGIRLVTADGGEPIGFGRAVLRDLAHTLDQLPLMVGWLFPLWDAQRQTFADKVVGTVVVKEPAR